MKETAGASGPDLPSTLEGLLPAPAVAALEGHVAGSSALPGVHRVVQRDAADPARGD